MAFLSTVWQILTSIPEIVKGIKALMIFAQNVSIERKKAENKKAIEEAMRENDQRPIEEIIRSPRAGKPSGHPGTELRDSLPGIMRDP